MSEEKLIHNQGQAGDVLEVIFEDDFLVAINKPNGLLVHKTRIAEEKKVFANILLETQLGCPVFTVHRLDRATSGVLLFAKSKEAASATQHLFSARLVEKQYIAVVRGFSPEKGETHEPLTHHDTGKVQAASTYFQRLGTVELPIMVNKYPTSRYSLVRMSPKTGRTHQLRRHFNHMAHPIVGDTKYGDLRHNHMFQREWGVGSLLLHAQSIRLDHPNTGVPLVVEAPLPADMKKVLALFNWAGLV